MAFGKSGKKPDPEVGDIIPRTDSVPPPPPPMGMFDPDVIEAADEDAQNYKEKASQEVTVKAYKKGTVGEGSSSKKKWYILAALLLLVVIIAAAVGGSMAAKNKSSSGNAASSSVGGGGAADDADDADVATGGATSTGGGTATGGGASTGGTTGGTTAGAGDGQEDDFAGVGDAVAAGADDLEEEDGCVPCSNIPTEFMVADGDTCETFDNLEGRCGVTGSWWFDDRDWDDDWVDSFPPQSYCQYSCYQAGVGYPDFSPCCPDVVEAFLGDGTKGVAETETTEETAAVEDGPCVPCTDIPDEYMLDNGLDCLTDQGIADLCGQDGSWWYNVRDWDDDWVDQYPAETYCQHSCDAMGLGYPSTSPCCAERGSDVNEFYDYDVPEEVVDDVTEVPATVTQEPTSMPTPEATPEFGDLVVDGDCDGANDEFCALCEGDCDEDVDCEDGYFCFQRDADEDIPGCKGDAEDGIDYCIPLFYSDN